MEKNTILCTEFGMGVTLCVSHFWNNAGWRYWRTGCWGRCLYL